MPNVNDQLTEALKAAQKTIEEQQETLEKIMSDPCSIGTVLSLDKKKAIIAVNREFLEVELPSFKVKVGDQITCTNDTRQILSVCNFVPNGNVVAVKKVVDSARAEVSSDGTSDVLVFTGGLKLEAGDRVMLDFSGQVIVHNFGQPKQSFSFTGDTQVRWDDIGGHHTAKEQMIEAIELPYRHPALFKAYNKKPIKGVLLSGPPGCITGDSKIRVRKKSKEGTHEIWHV